ncbi:MAG: radical SAM protein [Bacteroidetes bacterium GWF2_38_335]|nr:MAG: radical SAM protein [Bacteroidetes bacterium GWF2_38_335]OFY79986.1 MAG: radical SAM protein [Bacteroidetes bacterium RIFOXYA12_FULL_38_20]HBS86338.1 radical SAM protein [Bacteroidales bacterium]
MIMFYPISYHEPIFRPPSEALSLILQVTLGCSWNKCAFCEMYKSKNFKVRNEEDVFSEIDHLKGLNFRAKKLFLADGDAFVLSTAKLLRLLEKLNSSFNPVRVSAYAIAKNINNKSLEELIKLKEAGLKLLYIGIESGDDEVLRRIHKGETYNSTLDAMLKLNEAGIKSSVMILTGLGGEKYFEQHAINSAKLVSAAKPEFLSTLVLSHPFGVNHFIKQFDGEYIEQKVNGLLEELELFIKETNLENTVFRSDHASNYLVLKGFLSRDKEEFLRQIRFAIENPGKAYLRDEWQRGL